MPHDTPPEGQQAMPPPAVVVPVAPVPVAQADGKVVRPPETTGTKVARAILVLIGLAMIGLSVGGVVAGRIWGNETTETSTPSGPTGASGATGATGATGASGATTTTKKTTTKDFGSDELLTAGFATGAALVAFGLLLSRITVLKLPGGIEIGTTNKQETEEVKDQVEQKVKDGEVEPAKAPAVMAAALENVRAEKAQLATIGNPAWEQEAGSVAWGSTLPRERVTKSVNTAAAEHGSTES